MNVLYSIDEIKTFRKSLPSPVGFVPTMGYLHQGHLSLVKRAKSECASVVVSIFVNPAQFGPQEDLSVYPRDLLRDLSLLEVEAVDAVWAPFLHEMYPPGYQTWIEVEEVARPLEGSARPGHFRGVATVVAKLFNITQPHRAYFGQKDAQQVAVIQRMTLDLNFPLEIVVCPTVREADGLALSSRNIYLNEAERSAATILFKALSIAKQAFEQGESDANLVRETMAEVLRSEPLARVQYVSCANPVSLQELTKIDDRALLSLAVYIGKTRLIDNMVLQRN
jgi:pantoate--beta-alanine ligase